MKKPIILALVGALAGVAVAFGAFIFLFQGDAAPPAEAATPEVVSVPGKLGPHITLADRVFNLLPEPGQPTTYLKLQTIIEFETKDERWAHVLHGCGSEAHGAALQFGTDTLVSARPGGRPAGTSMPAAGGGEAGGCEGELAALMAEFESQIGSGRALIEDVVTGIVTGHTASEIATPAGKATLKAEIEAGVEELFGEHQHVTRVLFLNFITQ